MEKLNIAELLKGCPKGIKLYSPLCGECYFEKLNQGTIICKKRNTQIITFTSDGYYMLPVFDGAEPMIFPSKDQRDWSKFHGPFKDGDILFIQSAYSWILIYKDSENKEDIYKYAAIPGQPNHKFIVYDDNPLCCKEDVSNFRFATDEEKEKLFDTIKANGYKWNSETKTLEKLIEPKFKVGDRIKLIVENLKLCSDLERDKIVIAEHERRIAKLQEENEELKYKLENKQIAIIKGEG